MSRISAIQKITAKSRSKSIESFDYNRLTCINIMALFTPSDIDRLYDIATNIRYNGNVNKKYRMIDEVMRSRGFIRAHAGTNRVVYNYLEDSSFIAKVALDRVGIEDSPKEYINQRYFAPFCCKIFEVHPSGVIAFVERVNPISSLEEFVSVADDVFNMMVTKILGKYVVDDLGTKAYMNFGIRYDAMGCMFGPVVIDYPYAYELDEEKLTCTNKIEDPITHNKVICGGDLEYSPGFNGIYCTKCGEKYTAKSLAKTDSNCGVPLWISNDSMVKSIKHLFKAQIIDNDNVVKDSGRNSSTYISREEFDSIMSHQLYDGMILELKRPIISKSHRMDELREKFSNDLRTEYYNAQQRLEESNSTTIGDLIDDGSIDQINNEVFNNTKRITLLLDKIEIAKPKSSNNIHNGINGPLAKRDVTLTDGAIITLVSDISKVDEPEPIHSIVPSSNVMVENVVDETVHEIDTIIYDDTPQVEEEIHLEPVEASLDSQVVSDEVVESMIEENIHRFDTDDTDHSLDDILDSEKDKEVPELNPMNRGYSNASPDTLADYNPNDVERIIKSNPMDFAGMGSDHERDKEARAERRNINQQKDKRRNGYD